MSGTQDLADRQAAYAATLADEWARSGVQHAVVCPGSRSTPLAIALDRESRIEVHVRLDERGAGFTALGIGLATGRPALAVTTSGTAAAELHPAVVEADLARVPLLVCTADRPPEHRDVGAPQTIEQVGLYGSAVRWHCDPGVVADEPSRGWWRSMASRSVAEAALGSRGPGPVHLNLCFREPLVGDAARGGGVASGRPDGEPWHRVAQGALEPGGDALGALVVAGRGLPVKGLIVAGAGAGEPDAVLTLAEATRWPVLADPRSGLRRTAGACVAAADGILRSAWFAGEHRPDLVLHLGDRWASKAVHAALAPGAGTPARAVVVDPHGRWPDPDRSATALVRCDPSSLCRHLAGVAAELAGGDGAERDRWWAAWTEAEARARTAIVASMAGGDLDELTLADAVFDAVPDGGDLVVSSSMPIRDVESVAPPRRRPPRVLANRGANGIDGVVSTAIGAALGSGRPTVALVGDLAFLHDLSALVGLAAPGGSRVARAPLTVVVADNGGGGIFSFLDQADACDETTFERLFGTPQGSDPAAAAASLGWPVEVVGREEGVSAFRDALGRRIASGVPSVVVVRVPDRSENLRRHRRLQAAIDAALERAVPAQQGLGS